MLRKIDMDSQFKDFVAQEIPAQLIKKKPGQGDMHYISGCTVIDILNQLTNYAWDWQINEHWIQKSEPKFNPKYDKEPKPQGPVAHVIGTLTLHFVNENGEHVNISKTAAGAKPVIGGQNEQKDIYKSAATDALKKAASLLGVGAQLYRDEDEQEFFESLNYADPWTDEALAAHQHEFDYLKELMNADSGYTREDINEVLQAWNHDFNDINDLDPEELTSFVEYIKAQQSAAEQAGE